VEWEEPRVLDLTGAARRRRRRDERLALLREFAAGRGWTPRPSLPSVVTRHPVPRLLAAGPAAAELVLGGPWRSGGWAGPAELASLLLRPAGDRPSGARRGDDVLLLARVDLPPLPGALVVRVTGGDGDGVGAGGVGADGTGSSPALAAPAQPAVLRAARDGVLGPGDCLVLGESSLAVAGSWRPALAHREVLEAWFALLAVVAVELTATGHHAP